MISPMATNLTNADLLAGFATTALLCVPLMALIWMVRVMLSLRKRLDSMEDKLDVILFARHLETTSKKTSNKPDSQAEKTST
jgi:hypothetical protein